MEMVSGDLNGRAQAILAEELCQDRGHPEEEPPEESLKSCEEVRGREVVNSLMIDTRVLSWEIEPNDASGRGLRS